MTSVLHFYNVLIKEPFLQHYETLILKSGRLIEILYCFYLTNREKHSKLLIELYNYISNNVELFELSDTVRFVAKQLLLYKPFTNIVTFNKYNLFMNIYVSTHCCHINKLTDDTIFICGHFVSDLYNGFINNNVYVMDMIYKTDDDLDLFLIKLSLLSDYKLITINNQQIIIIKNIPRIIYLFNSTIQNFIMKNSKSKQIYIYNNTIYKSPQYTLHNEKRYNYDNEQYWKLNNSWKEVWELTEQFVNIWSKQINRITTNIHKILKKQQFEI